MTRTASLIGTTTAVDPKILNTFHRNPRRGDVAVIAASLRAHGQYKPITVNLGTHTGRPNEVLAGNHTLMAFRDLCEADPGLFQEIKVHWVDVDDDMCNRIVIADNRTSELGGFDTTELVALLDTMNNDLEGLGYTTGDIEELKGVLDGMGGDAGGEGSEEGVGPQYSGAVDIPQYVPSDNPPPLSECIDTSRTLELETAISEADLPDDVASFLMTAAQRHTVINFGKVADYYGSAPPVVQALMEQQALVIIDIDDAIREGYVQLSTRMEDLLGIDLIAKNDGTSPGHGGTRSA